MGSKNDENFIAFCDELRAYVEEHHLFPQKHSRMLNAIKYTRKKIKEGKLDEEKRLQFEALLAERSNEHTGGRRKKKLMNNQ